ncbi:MAG: hypothetical protein GXP33_01925 [Spirochaetes bacterium]|nr:hypothetical protein [Spirochaetota bacterium]
MSDRLVRKFKDEAVSVYSIDGERSMEDFKRYVVSTRDTRDLMNFPEIINTDFTNLMQNGITNALKGVNILERISRIDSKSVNVFHILRGGLNFMVRDALKKAFGYKWHSSSYISSQRILKEGKFEVSEDQYRKFVLPDNATIYTADIVASGISLDHALQYLHNFLNAKNYHLKNMIFITIGCVEAERVMEKWHKIFKKEYPGYKKTFMIYLEGRFALASKDAPLFNYLYDTDLLKNYKLGALLAPELEHSQFERTIIGLEGCTIYDGGKKGFEPINHIKDILEFWEKQLDTAKSKNLSLWNEYNARFPLNMYFEDFKGLNIGDYRLLAERKSEYWQGLDDKEYIKLFKKFRWLWTDARVKNAALPGSLVSVCEKKIKYLKSLIEGVA